VALEF
jgi:hypothetical protein